MTILEQLATTQVPEIAHMIEARRVPPSEDATERPNAAGKWENQPAWDNWTQKPPPFKKKTLYFKKK